MKIDINEYAEGAVLLDGFHSAIIGIVSEFGNGPRILYSKSKIIEILENRDGMTNSEAEEYYDFNILGLYANEQNAVFLDLELTSFKTNHGFEYVLK
jgi:hypothetical protein